MSLDTAAEQEKTRQLALAAAVAAGFVSPVQVWPEYFTGPASDEEAVPSVDADMSDFRWESATEASAEADLAALMAQNQVVVLPDGPDPLMPAGQDDLEWT